MKHLKRITLDPAVMGGKACIRGMRVTAATIIGLLAANRTRYEILKAYPYLEPEDIDQALAYAAWRVEEREVPLSDNIVGYQDRIRLSPDGESVLAPGSEKRARVLYRIDTRKGKADIVARSPSPEEYIAGDWSPDGQAIYYHSYTSPTLVTNIIRHDLTSGQEKSISLGSNEAFPVVLSPDGRHFAFRSGTRTISVIPSTGGEPREILKLRDPEYMPGYAGVLAWSGDSQHVIFARWELDSDGRKLQKSSLWRVPAAGANAEPLGIEMHQVQDQRAHPDGRRIAFTAGTSKFEAWVLENILPKDKLAAK